MLIGWEYRCKHFVKYTPLPSFNKYLVSNDCVTGFILQKFSLHYLPNRSDYDVGMLCYIDVN